MGELPVPKTQLTNDKLDNRQIILIQTTYAVQFDSNTCNEEEVR